MSTSAIFERKSSLADVFEIDFVIKFFGREIFRFHYPPLES